MNTAFELLSQLRNLGAEISVAEGRIRLSAAKGVLTPELRDELARHKAEIVALLGSSDIAAEQRSAPALMARPRGEALPLSFAQQRMWLLQRLFPDNSSYNIALALRLRGPVDTVALEKSLSALIARHEVLRTTFRDEGGTPVQVIESPRDVPLTVTEVSDDGTCDGRSAHARRIVEEEALRPFDLASEMPIRTSLLRIGEDDHVLLIVLHHIAADGWSLAVFNRELAALYDARVREACADLGELPVQYADYAHWQRVWLTHDVVERHVGYWRQQLANAAPLELPIDRPRPRHQTFRGARESEVWPASLWQDLEQLSQRAGASLFITLLAAFDVLLHRYSGQDDIVVGSPVANRDRTELEGLVGCFLNTLILRSDLAGDPSFVDLLARVRDVVLGAFKHQDLPFERLVEELEPVRDLSRNPLFQVAFTVHNAPEQRLELSGLAVSDFPRARHTTNFDLDVHVWPAEDGLRVFFVYNPDLFDAATVRGMVSAFRVLVEALVRQPDERISALPMRADAGPHFAAGPAVAARGHARVHDLFGEQVARTPDAVAVACEDERLTYAQLDERANRLARHLRQLGVCREVLAGIGVERGLDMVVACLGILKAGGAFVPLDPSFPRDRLAHMLEDTGARVLVTQRRLAPQLPPFEGELVFTDQGEAWTLGDGMAPEGDARGGDLAYVIYTSGSTGVPKGVQITHEAVVNFLDAMRQRPGLDSEDVLLAVTTLSFDIAVLELFLPLCAGARLEIASRAVVADAHLLRQKLVSTGTTVLQATPATWEMLISAGWEGDGRLKMLCGGEALSRSLADQLLARGGELWNLYGPTETTIWSAVGRVEQGTGPVTIGEPIAGTQLCVLDAHQRPVPPGAPGELHIGGVGLARGYLGRPELTAEKFVPRPWPDDLPGRLYKTGDLVRRDASGQLRFLGRMDHQVKLRGFRIELGEIEAVLSRHPGVEQAVAIVREESAGDRRLVAYLVAAAGQSPEPAELRAFAQNTLPDYMVPGAFVTLDELPLSPAGKVDRRRLAALQPPVPAAADPHARAAPSGPTEEAVARAFAEVLAHERVGAHDDFFVLGGHSLLATRLVSRIRKIFQIELRLRDVFETPTVAGLAECIEQERHAGQRVAAPPIRRISRDTELPLSFAQRRLWFLHQMGTGAAYHMQLSLGLTGPLDRAALSRTLQAIAARHEVLRTHFVAVDGRPRQVIADDVTLPVRDLDRSDVSPENRLRAVREIAGLDVDQPFDLERGPLIRATLVRLAADEHALVLTLHHIVADGWSIGVLIGEIAAHYGALVAADPTSLAVLPVQYADFAAWQRDRLGGDKLDTQLAYWREQLAGDLPVLRLPTDRPRAALPTFGGASHGFEVDATDTEALRALSQECGVTLAMVMLAAFQTLFARYTGQDDIAVGSPIAGRTHAELEELIGLFVNALVMRTDFSGDPTFVELLRRVQRVALAAYDHQDVPFDKLVDELVPERDLSRTPLFQVVFAVQNVPQVEWDSAGLSLCLLPAEVTATRYDLEMYLFEQPSHFTGRLVYNRDLFDATTIERMVGHFLALLKGILARPEARVSELPLLTEAEQQLLANWNDTAIPDPDDRCVHHWIEDRAAAQPEAIALIHRDRLLTYGELNARANRIAHTLRSEGVGPDVIVGLCVERGPDLVAGVLGVLKAGGAYLPLDPEYPRARLAFMLADARAPVLLTQEQLVGQLPEHTARVITMDGEAIAGAAAPDTDPSWSTHRGDLAYAIYTSGSTGTPKAALLTHRGLCNVSREQARAFGVGPESRVLQFASFSFDAATFEVMMALPHGATLVVGDRAELLPGPDLLGFLRRHAISVVTLPPSALAAMAVDDLPSLSTITVAGEACPAEVVRRWAPGRRFFNLYGPTEATIWSTMTQLEAGDEPHVGRPIGNTQIHVLDAHDNPVPVGVSGELCIGGVGLARGYHDRPEMTAERFIPNRHSNEPGDRLYRSGDLARWRSDGRLDFLGRIDHQVKLRGFRIELGEIEAVLDTHAGVLQSLAAIREDVPGDRRLVAYVLQDPTWEPEGETSSAREQDRVSQWLDFYDELYERAASPESGAFSGWSSSYTGGAIPPEEMREWRERTVERILAEKPQRVLEIGCGTGLLLLPIAPHCTEYVGTDFSQAALDHLAEQCAGLEDPVARIQLLGRAADDFTGIPTGHFDTIVLNSVAQYFPSADYLVGVLEGAVEMLRPGGRIFVGDVRSLPLLGALHASVQLYQADGDLSVDRLRQRTLRQLNEDRELVVHPAFFAALANHDPRIRQIEIEPKPGRYDNELSRFRYDVVLRLGGDGETPTSPEPRWLDWGPELTLEAIRDLLEDPALECLGVRNVANRRTLSHVRAAEILSAGEGPTTAAELAGLVATHSADAPALDPDDLRALCNELPFACAVSWAEGRPDGSFDALFRRRSADQEAPSPWAQAPLPVPHGRSWSDYTNQPLRARRLRELVPRLRRHAGEQLPEYMVPSDFVVMDEFPLTPNRKVDRRALPAPDALRLELADAYEAPRSDTEELLVGVWERVLGHDRVGIHDRFFELGGDSILSIQLVAAAREVGLHLTAVDLFQNQTVAELATVTGSAAVATAEQGPVTGPVLLTPIQHWFLEQDLVDAHHFNQAILVEPATALDPDLLEAALARLIAHHDGLRLRFSKGAAGWHQEIGPPAAGVPLEVHDLTGVPVDERPRSIEMEACRLQSSFDLAEGPLVRAALFAAADEPGGSLLLVIHHLAVDAVSWRILLEDLARALDQIRSGVAVQLPPKTTSLAEWSRGLHTYTQSAAVRELAAYWRELPWDHVVPLPVDRDLGPNTVASMETVDVALTPEQTRELLQEVPKVLGAQAHEALITALVRALRSWTGHPCVLVDLEGHGREEVLDGIDVSRTVGWFTAIYPVVFSVSDTDDAVSGLRAVAEQLHAIRGRGLTYGLARYLSEHPSESAPLREHPRAEVSFNFLGQLDQAMGAESAFRAVDAALGPSRGPRNRRAHLLEVGGSVLRGRLKVGFTFSENVHARETIDRLARQFLAELIGLLGSCSASTGTRAAPDSSANEFGWSRDDLDDIYSEIEGRD